MKIVVTVRKFDNWKEKLIRNIFQSGFFPYKKYTLICGEDFTERKFNIRGASQISFPTKRV